jgi:hypothetical protein
VAGNLTLAGTSRLRQLIKALVVDEAEMEEEEATLILQASLRLLHRPFLLRWLLLRLLLFRRLLFRP